jgi:hypothetical protein
MTYKPGGIWVSIAVAEIQDLEWLSSQDGNTIVSHGTFVKDKPSLCEVLRSVVTHA